MIKFFRTIRQKLLSENKFSKYLIYAIGEIVLVVIGILIALQINKWNENKKNKKVEIVYLKGIENNIGTDISELKLHFANDTLKLNAYTYLIKALNSGVKKSQYRNIISNAYIVGKDNWFEGQNVVFEDMKSSGKLGLIQNDSIKYAIQDYYRFFGEVIKQEDVSNYNIRKIRDRNSQFVNISSYLEPLFPKQWNGKTGPPNVSFMEKSNFSEVGPKMMDNFSEMKVNQFNSHRSRIKLYEKAKVLKIMLENYLIVNENS
ncbi:DUF6090 family protein [Marinifilum flexuosum]|uniref:Uncharacterized protein n=1 Tax=Marinifilum flexuosum TaxID=1117708 RepID=A0A419X4K2_9BACT|nr:DUF6090 family protein [Marinifilum flexuosum]RKE02540.1 hypothetical protein BXY64_2635 [Marinifilum flexuosum]